MGQTVSLRSIADACMFVDELDALAIGELAVKSDEGPLGSLFVQTRRICWVAARGMAQRLTELLTQPTTPPGSMERHFLRCKAERIPLGEDLVARGVVSGAELRRVLLAHSAESLRHLCRPGSVATWTPRKASYSPTFTFPTSELWSRGTVVNDARLGEMARARLARLFDTADGDWGAAFVRPASAALPEPVALAGAFPVRASTLLRAGRWAASALDVARAVADSEPSLFVQGEDERSFAAFAEDSLGPGAFIVGETTSAGTARILHRRAFDDSAAKGERS